MKTLLSLIVCALLLSAIGCKKKPSAGLGGSAKLIVNVKHHNTTIDSSTVYIKFNSSEVPDDNQYDLNQKLVTDSNGNSFTVFEGLKTGDYYIFAQGWDPTISENVKGAVPYTIKTETEQSITVPVTETH